MIYNSGIWYGENHEEIIENDNGIHPGYDDEMYAIGNMFDVDAVTSKGNPTIWYSGGGSYEKVKTLQFTFKQPINFDRLKIKNDEIRMTKRMTKQYKRTTKTSVLYLMKISQINCAPIHRMADLSEFQIQISIR